MDCSACGTSYQLFGDDEDGYVRSLCPCDAKAKCSRCKRGHHQPCNQASLDLEYEVQRYACAPHGHPDAFNFPELAPSGRSTIPPPKAMEVKEIVQELPWNELRNVIVVNHKRAKERVSCLGCGEEHVTGKRKLVFDDGKRTATSLCPNCEEEGYRCLL